MAVTETYSFVTQQRPSLPKDPQSVLDYTFDWTDWLAGVSDTILSRTITVDGVTVGSSILAGDTVTVWLAGGTVGAVASCTCEIVTAAGRTDQRTIYLLIQER